MASVTSRDVLARGFRVLGRAIRDEPRIFTFAVGGSVLFGGLVVGSAYVIGHIVGASGPTVLKRSASFRRSDRTKRDMARIVARVAEQTL